MMKQPWIGKPSEDILFIILPPFLSLLVIAVFPEWFRNNAEMNELSWIVLVVLIDVAHVYSTLYRTYFDPNSLKGQRQLLWVIPFAGFVAGVMIYTLSALWFWRLLAYVAVFHFVRQQYGFMRVYSRYECRSSLGSWIDTIGIYTATIFPLLYWHLSGPKNFNWFLPGDFVTTEAAGILSGMTMVYWLIVALYLAKEILSIVRYRKINVPKLGVISGTFLSWYFGIVYFNGDLAFTLLNVVSHGIPYLALIWIYGEKNYRKKGSRFLKLVFSKWGVLIFLGLIALFAFAEEHIWDSFVWNEHNSVFGNGRMGDVELARPLLSILIPLLALPQITHYILDGFIWKVRKAEFEFQQDEPSV